ELVNPLDAIAARRGDVDPFRIVAGVELELALALLAVADHAHRVSLDGELVVAKSLAHVDALALGPDDAPRALQVLQLRPGGVGIWLGGWVGCWRPRRRRADQR